MQRRVQPSVPFLPFSSLLRKSISYFPPTKISTLQSGAKKDFIPFSVVHASHTLLISELTVISPEINLSLRVETFFSSKLKTVNSLILFRKLYCKKFGYLFKRNL
jgi:hypothetical protein